VLPRGVRSRRAARCLLLAASLVGLPACGGGGDGPTVAHLEVGGKGGDVLLRGPSSIKGGLVELELQNTSDERRDAQIVRVEGKHSTEEFLKVIQSEGGPIPNWIQDGGGVPQVDPGQTGTSIQNLATGNYFVFSGPEGDGQPARTELEVKDGGRPGPLPKASAEIVARDYAFDVNGLKAGKNKVLFKNAGTELHHAVGAPLRPGKTVDDVTKFARAMSRGARPSGPPPFDEKGGFSTAVIDGGVEQVIDLDVKRPGRYVIMCFITDRKGGPPHIMKGMIKEIEVK